MPINRHILNTYSFIINSRIMIHMSNEIAWHPVQEKEEIFKKKVATFKTF